jgi:putative ABC transport system substrate-binding protein
MAPAVTGNGSNGDRIRSTHQPDQSQSYRGQAKELQTAAQTLGLQIHLVNASTDREFEAVFTTISELHASGLVITSDSFFFVEVDRLAALATHYKVPAIFGFREFPKAGGLMSYGADVVDLDRTLGAMPPSLLLRADEVIE